MADQKRWFKVWVSILDDPHFQELSLEDIGRWTLLGALTAFVGTKGRLRTPSAARRLRETLRMNGTEPLKEAIERLPSVSFEEGKNRDGDFFVTWAHWSKYQRDAMAADRMRTLRSKRREEEKRKEENKIRTPGTPQRGVLSDAEFLDGLRQSPAYKNLDIGLELAKMDNWLQTPRGRGKKKTRGRIVAWLNRALEDLPVAAQEDTEWRGLTR